jgi:general secretion pathway protein C
MQLPANVNDINELLLRLPQQKIAKMISVLLLGYIAYVLAQLTWLFIVPESNKTNLLPSTTNNASTLKKLSFVDTTRLEALNLFGLYQEQITIEPVQVQDAPETNLNLILTGTVTSSKKSIAAAVIENNGKQETYGIGDKIVGTRATLDRVFTDRVLIKQTGRLETLMLDGIKYNKANASAKQKASVPTNRKTEATTRGSRNVNKATILDQRSNKALSKTASLLKKEINDDPRRITEYLRIAPKRQGGKVVGYRLMPGKDPEFFKASGLKSGDVAVVMNGLDLSLPSEAAQALKALKEQQELSLLIDRNGEMTEILFGINK